MDNLPADRPLVDLLFARGVIDKAARRNAFNLLYPRTSTRELVLRTILFKENTEDRYESAKYGAFRVGESGDHILMDLADENLQKLTIIKE